MMRQMMFPGGRYGRDVRVGGVHEVVFVPGDIYLDLRESHTLEKVSNGHFRDLDGGNSALVIGFSRNQFWGLKNTIFKGISEPPKLP